VIDETIGWLKEEYTSIFEDGSGTMKVHRGKVHKYLGMTLDFSNKGQCVVTMFQYLDGIMKAYDLVKSKYDIVMVEAATTPRWLYSASIYEYMQSGLAHL
jgi:hypothetical protein